MTDIKSAIETIENRDSIMDYCENRQLSDALDLSIRSLNAWSEVLNELEETKEHATDLVRPKNFGMKLKEFTDMCFDEAINIIKQKLADIEGG